VEERISILFLSGFHSGKKLPSILIVYDYFGGGMFSEIPPSERDHVRIRVMSYLSFLTAPFPHKHTAF